MFLSYLLKNLPVPGNIGEAENAGLPAATALFPSRKQKKSRTEGGNDRLTKRLFPFRPAMTGRPEVTAGLYSAWSAGTSMPFHAFSPVHSV